MKLPLSFAAIDTESFTTVLKTELEQLPAEFLPLQEGLSYSSMVSDQPFSVVVLGCVQLLETVRVSANIFYEGVVAGCSCADDPTPVDTVKECIEVQFTMDRRSGDVQIELCS